MRAYHFIETESGNREVAFVPGSGGGFLVEVMSERHHQPALLELWSGTTREEREVSVRLEVEPTNPQDPNAVAVRTFKGALLGYLPRAAAMAYNGVIAALTKDGRAAVCQAKPSKPGGTNTKVRLWLDLTERGGR